MIVGDLAFYIGIVGIILYLCLMIIRYTMNSTKIVEACKRYDERTAQLQQKVDELRAERDQKSPQVDELVATVVSLRQRRDALQTQYEETAHIRRDRDIEIKTNAR